MKDSSNDPFAELDELLGEPILLRHDDRERYRALQEKVERLLKPKDLFDALDARDFVNAVWDGARFQSQAAELLNTQWRKALKELACRKSGFVSEKAAKSIEAYLAAPQNVMTQNGMTESRMLRESGLSGAAVEAHSVLLAKDNLLVLDKLVSSRNATRDHVLKAYRRRQAAKEKRLAAKEKRIAAKAKRKAAKALELADRANDNRPSERMNQQKSDSAWD
jgi:hypothetical protein